MKIAITTNGQDLDGQVDPRFGRCGGFLVVDTDSMTFDFVPNPNAAVGGGAGIQSAQLLANQDVKAVLTGNCGPNAFQTLQAAGVDVFTGVSGVVRDAVEQYKSGALTVDGKSNVGSHFGTSR